MGLTTSRQQTDNDPAVTLRGTQRGLEVEIQPGQETAAIVEGLRVKLSESPGFWAGSNVILRFLGELVPGSLGELEAVCAEFDLKIVGIRSPLEERNKTARAALAVVNELAEGSVPVPVIKPPRLVPEAEAGAGAETGTETETETAAETETGTETETAAAITIPVPVPILAPPVAPADADADAVAVPDAVPRELPVNAGRFIRGPIRSGVIFESDEHLIILGDVNPGAEVRSPGGIVVLGRLRGVAHAGADAFIIALELAPQQLRLGELVARAADAEVAPGHAEIAFARDGQIIVETFRGALPRQLWSLIAE